MKRFSGIWLAIAVTVAGAVLGCESDLGGGPVRRYSRAVQSPEDRASPNNEVVGEATAAVPLVTVDLPNSKEDKPVVHTIADGLLPAASQPASAPAPGASGGAVKVVESRKMGDLYQVGRTDEGDTVLTITSTSGVGSAVLERTGETWPASVTVRLQYGVGRPFTSLEGFTAQEAVGQGQGVELKSTVNKASGMAEIRIPGFTRSPRIAIEWMDAHR